MFSFKCNIFVSIVFGYLELTQSLVELPPIEENVIIKSEAIIRNTFNSLFYNLKLKKSKANTKLKEYYTIHKYFTSLALQDFDNLNRIVRIARVHNKNINKMADFIGLANNSFALNQFVENNKNATDNDEIVTTYIYYFLKILKKFKENNSVDKVYKNIHTNIFKLLTDNLKQSNDSSYFYKSDNDNDNILNENEFWDNLKQSNDSFYFYKSDNDNDNILNENEFWEPTSRRIFKGDRTKIKKYPFMASIQIFNNFYCAGSIVKSDLIITASSCLQLAWNNRLFRENPAFLSARVGSSFYSGGGEVIPVLEIYFHPGYNPKNLRNNVCILRLVRHLNFKKRNKRIKKIDFDRQPSSLPVTTPGITILGWGARQHSPVIGNPWKNVLSFTVLHVYPLKECRDVYSREYVTRKNFCAGFFSRGGGACNRDVGGPGIAGGKLMGVISFGSPVCGTPDAPTVFTKLGYYSDWIEEIMEMDVPVSKKRTTLKPLHDPFTASPSYTTIKSTSFKIPALTGENVTPIPISLTDNDLRIFDENVFKEFLATMFHSEEVAQNQDDKDVKDSLNLDTTFTHRTKYYYEEVTETSKRVTEFEDISTEESTIRHKNTRDTTINEDNQSFVHNSDGDIEKLIGNVNLKKIVEEEVMVTPITVDKDMSAGGDINISSSHKSKTVPASIYLSDDERDGIAKNIPVHDNMMNDESHDRGMSIPVDFDDLTRAKDKIRVLPESELFKLLSEVIGEEIPNVHNNS